MRRLSQFTTGWVGLCVVVCLHPAAAQKPQNFVAQLSASPMDLAERDVIAGHGSVTAVLNGSKLTITGSFDELRSPAISARLHLARVTGIRGTPMFDLSATRAASGSITGTVDLNASQIESLRKGQLYVQLNSEGAPNGNLWGWLLQRKEKQSDSRR